MGQPFRFGFQTAFFRPVVFRPSGFIRIRYRALWGCANRKIAADKLAKRWGSFSRGRYFRTGKIRAWFLGRLKTAEFSCSASAVSRLYGNHGFQVYVFADVRQTFRFRTDCGNTVEDGLEQLCTQAAKKPPVFQTACVFKGESAERFSACCGQIRQVCG